MEYFDTHAHLSDERFDPDRDALIASFPQKGVTRVLDVACDLRSTGTTLELIRRYEHVYAAVGMHPHEAQHMQNGMMDELRRLLRLPKVCALGEIGLDYHYDFSPRDVQKKWFVEQLELAKELDVPVVLHVREAFGDALEILRAHKQGLKGVMHCFSGSIETAFECLNLGLYISFGGAITFENARRLTDVASRLPLERLLIETDCPYLAPVPFRGKRNDPTLVALVAKKLADLQGVGVEEAARITYENGLDCFGMRTKSEQLYQQ
ncbi:MAG: TatD family hydrolase [Bacillota bacterium]